MKLYFYKAEYGDWKDYLIGWWTKSKYSHVELLLDSGVFFSSSPREGRVRMKEFVVHADHWDIVDLPESCVYDYYRLEEVMGKKYDWLGIFAHEFLPLGIQNSNKWWCSEVISYVLGIDDYRLDPQELYEAVEGKADGC